MEYDITDKPSTLRKPTSNAILEQIHQVLGNLVRNCNITQVNVDEDDPCLGNLAAGSSICNYLINK